MEQKTFKTLIKANHRYSDEYAKCRISGIALSTTGSYSTNKLLKEKGSLVMKHTCTEKEYADFRSHVEVVYPGLCIFNYRGRM